MIEFDALNLSEYDVHSVSGVFKKLIRDVPNGYIPSNRNQMFLNSDASLESLEAIIDELPDISYYFLRYILVLLMRIASFQNVNKMGLYNLCLMFTPTLFKFDSGTENGQAAEQMVQENDSISHLSKILIGMLKYFVPLFLEVVPLTTEESKILGDTNIEMVLEQSQETKLKQSNDNTITNISSGINTIVPQTRRLEHITKSRPSPQHIKKQKLDSTRSSISEKAESFVSSKFSENDPSWQNSNGWINFNISFVQTTAFN